MAIEYAVAGKAMKGWNHFHQQHRLHQPESYSIIHVEVAELVVEKVNCDLEPKHSLLCTPFAF